MNRQLPSQPQFNIQIQGLSGKRFDVTEFVDWGVVYDERADLIRTLNFTIGKRAEFILERLQRGLRVIFTGGTLTRNGKLFEGDITKLKTIFPESGAIKINVECMSTSWAAFGKDTAKFHVYPDPLSTRTFAIGKPALKISEIVKGIINNAGMNEGKIIIPQGADVVYDYTKAIHQDGISDWAMLRRLGKICGCTVWTETVNDTEVVNFVDRSKARNMVDSDLSFLYPLRKGNEYVIKQQKENQFEFQSLDVTEDIADANAVSYSGSRFDTDSGEETQLIAQVITEGDKRKIYYYELDEDKVAKLEETNPNEAKRLRDMGMFNIPFAEAVKYFKTKEVIDEDVAVYDQAFYGISATGTVPGDIRIRSQRTYKVYGIARYSSTSTENTFYLQALTHRWDESGMTTDLVFKR